MILRNRSRTAPRAELIREHADELGVFTVSDLSEGVIKQGLYGQVPALSEDLMRILVNGVKWDVRGALRSGRLNNGADAYVCINRDEPPLWKPWLLCTRKESRYAMVLRYESIGRDRRRLAALIAVHNERFASDSVSMEWLREEARRLSETVH